MADIVDKATRSRIMSGIKGKNTKPEIIVRKALHAAGFRFRLHDKKIPGRPDIVLKKYNAVVLVHGCFWHGHDCDQFRWPKSRKQFWREKIRSNKKRDLESKSKILMAGWRILTVWECAMRGQGQLGVANISSHCDKWLLSQNKISELRGNDAR